MPINTPRFRSGSKDAQATTRADEVQRSASDEAVAELQDLVKVRLRSERGPRCRAAAAKRSPENRAAFPKSEAAKEARDAILGLDCGEDEQKDPLSDGIDDESLYVDLTDRFSPADRVFSSAQSWVHVCLRIFAGTLTVVAGCELAYTLDLMAFEAGRSGPILAAVLACFVAARWITKE